MATENRKRPPRREPARQADRGPIRWRGALHYMHYNFCRIHKTLRVTPAMAAGVTDRVWDMNEVAALIAAQEAPVAKRGPYKKKAA